MKTQNSLVATLFTTIAVAFVCALPVGAQPADVAPELVNGLPFPLVAPAKAQQLAIPQPIVLDLDDVTLKTALGELQKQSGVRFGITQGLNAEQLDTVVSVHLTTPSFDRAFQEIMDEAGIQAQLQDWGRYQKLHLALGAEESEKNPQKSGAGLFGINLSSIGTTLNKSIDLGDSANPQRSETLNLSASLRLLADRRLPVVGKPLARLTRAEDEQGRSLLPEANDNGRAQSQVNAYDYYSGSSWELQRAAVNLRSPAPDAKKLAHLEGVIVYALVTKTGKWEVPDLLSAPAWNHSFETADGTVAVKVEATIAPPSEEDEEGGLKLRIEAVSSNQEESYERISYPISQFEPLLSSISLEDGNGIVYSSSSYGGTSGKNIVIRALFAPEGGDAFTEAGERRPIQGPFKFVMNPPLEVVQTEVPFAFENVPLP